MHISDGAILCDSVQLQLPLLVTTKQPPSHEGQCKGHPGFCSSRSKLLLRLLGSEGMGMCEGAALNRWQQVSAHNRSNIHNLIMTFTLSIWRQTLTTAAAACRWTSTTTPPTHSALLAGPKREFLTNHPGECPLTITEARLHVMWREPQNPVVYVIQFVIV